MMPKDEVFMLHGVWVAMVDGKVYGDWDNKGAATAGMETEQRRAAKSGASGGT